MARRRTAAAAEPAPTPISAMIRTAMLEEGLSYGGVEARGGPSRQTTWNLVMRSAMKRPPKDETVEQLAKALPSLSEQAIRQAIANSLQLTDHDEPAGRDPWSAFGRLLQEKATVDEQELVLAAARGMWDQLRKRRQ